MKLFVCFALALGACGGKPTPAAQAPAPPANPQLDAMIARIDEALGKRPDDRMLLLLRATATADAGRKADAIASLERLDALEWDVPFTPVDFKPLRGDAQFEAIAARIAARAPKVKRSELAFTIPGKDFIPEGIAVDPATGTFYIGSIRKRTIVAVDRDRKVRTFVPAQRDGITGVLGLKVDAARGLLWATSWASAGMEGFTPADKGRAEVTAFALADGSMKRRAWFAAGTDPHLLNDIAIASDGTLYVTDSEAGAVWRVPPDRDVLEPVVKPGSLAYPNGIVLTAANKLLVAHGTGIAIVDPATGEGERLDSDPRIVLGGIDGMLLDGRTLYAVQGGLGAPRIVAIALDEAGTRATALRVLENDPSVLEIPTTATLYEGALFTIANAQLDALGPEGLIADKAVHEPRIVRTPVQ